MVAAVGAFAAGSGADETGRLVVAAARMAAPVTVDGRLDEPVWGDRASPGAFIQRRPDEARPATEPTDLWVFYDDDALYVGARLHDRQPASIVRRLSRRDAAVDADTFTLILDPQHDHLTGVQFRVSAAGVQQDALVYNDSFLDSSWDAVWTSAVSIDERGWAVELRIPFSQLRFQRVGQMVWGMNASRLLHRRNEESWLVMTPSDESGIASRTAHLQGLEGLSGVRHLELLPYASTRGELIAPVRAGNPFNDGSRLFGAAGLDVKYRLTSSLTFDATVNPDFGQVEVDPAVVNLQPTEVYYDEKRPFFVEGNPAFRSFGRGGASEQYGFFRTEPESLLLAAHRPHAAGARGAGLRRSALDHDHPRCLQVDRADGTRLDGRRARSRDRARGRAGVERPGPDAHRCGTAHELHGRPRGPRARRARQPRSALDRGPSPSRRRAALGAAGRAGVCRRGGRACLLRRTTGMGADRECRRVPSARDRRGHRSRAPCARALPATARCAASRPRARRHHLLGLDRPSGPQPQRGPRPGERVGVGHEPRVRFERPRLHVPGRSRRRACARAVAEDDTGSRHEVPLRVGEQVVDLELGP